MERLDPINLLEADLRRQGVFILVDPSSRKLWFYGYKPDMSVIRQMMASIRGRSEEMARFLIARASAKNKGETT
jgi:hypothetical protein